MVLTEARRQGGQLEAGSFSEILLIDSLCSPCGQASLVDLRSAPGLSKKIGRIMDGRIMPFSPDENSMDIR